MALKWKPGEVPGRFVANVACICGRSVPQVNEVEPVKCSCGALIWLVYGEANDNLSVTGEAPDGYVIPEGAALQINSLWSELAEKNDNLTDSSHA